MEIILSFIQTLILHHLKINLILSKQFLLTKYSSPDLIMKFIMNQLELACLDFEFELEHDKFFYLIFKYKKIIIN